MKTLTDSAAVVALAFADGEYIDEAAVPGACIAAAEERYLLPVLGSGLYGALMAGKYADFRDEYVVPAAALYTRLLMQPDLNVRTGQFGATVPSSATFEAAPHEQTREAMRSLRQRARTMLRRMNRRLGECASDFAEYDPMQNVMNRCSTDGSIVQIL